MASLIPDIGTVSTNTTGAMQNYLGTVKATNDALEKPADILNAHVKNMLEQRRLDKDMALKQEANARANVELGMHQDKFNRETNEYNRELGLRDVRKNLAAEFEANPYADVWGGGAQNKLLDKQVLDYVNSGGEIDADKAAELQQKEYEATRPFKEDIAQVFKSRLLAAGEDPTKADAYAKSMTDSMPFSRATLQSQLDKQQEIQQGYYNAVAAANKDVAHMGIDIAKSNQNANVDQAKLDLEYKKLMYGNAGVGGSGSGGTNADGDKITSGGIGGISQILKSIGPIDAGKGNKDVEAWHDKGYSYQQIYTAMKDAVDRDPTALVLHDNTLNTKAVNEKLAMLTPGANPFVNTTKVDPIASNVNAKDILAQFAPRQIAAYDPESVLAKAKSDLPWLSSGVSSTATGNTSPSITGSNTKTPVVSSKDGYDATRRYIESSSVGDKVNYAAGTKGSESFDDKGMVKNKGQAIGADQFLPSTLNEYRKPQYGFGNFTDKQFVESPELQNKIAELHTAKNEAALINRGIEVNDYTKWLAHNLGAGNVKAFVEGNETPQLKTAMSAQFGGKPTSIDDYNNHFKPFFDGDVKYSKAGSLVEDKNKSIEFDKMDPKSSGNLAQDRADLVEKSNVLTKILEKNRGDKDTVSELAKVKEALLNLDYVLADRAANGMKDERSIVANTITGSNVAPSAPVPKLDKNGNLVDTRDNLTSGPNIFSDIGGSLRNAYDKFAGTGKDGSPAKAALATANSIAGDAINTLTSPYTAMKYGTDSLMGYNHKPSVFQNMASDAHDTAINELSKVTDHPEAALIGATLATPLGSSRLTGPLLKGMASIEPEVLANNVIKSDGIVNKTINSIKSNSAKSDAEYSAKMAPVGKEAEQREIVRREAEIKAEADKLKNIIKPSEESIKEGRDLLKRKLEDKLNVKIKSKEDGKEFVANYLNRLVTDRANGKISDEELLKSMRELRDGGYISTRELMESLDDIGFKVK